MAAFQRRWMSTHRGKAIMVCATQEHTGKTSVSMALIAGLVRRYGPGRVSYMKPVGQKHVLVEGAGGESLKVDKDVAVAKEHFGLPSSYNAMSPLVLYKGYTRSFLDGKIDPRHQEKVIREGFEELIQDHDFVVVEGTGHIGVGSVVGMNNADVAKLLGLEVLLVGNGGLGSTYDVLALNRSLCRAMGVRVRAVLLNKVQKGKEDMVRNYIGKALQLGSWDAAILGVVPWADNLDQPSTMDLEVLFDTTALAGRQHLFRRYSRFELVTTSLRQLLEKLGDGGANHTSTCFVTHATRNDIILGLLSHAQRNLGEKSSGAASFDAGIILTGTPPGHIPHSFVRNSISRAAVPVLSVGMSTSKVVRRESLSSSTHISSSSNSGSDEAASVLRNDANSTSAFEVSVAEASPPTQVEDDHSIPSLLRVGSSSENFTYLPISVQGSNQAETDDDPPQPEALAEAGTGGVEPTKAYQRRVTVSASTTGGAQESSKPAASEEASQGDLPSRVAEARLSRAALFDRAWLEGIRPRPPSGGDDACTRCPLDQQTHAYRQTRKRSLKSTAGCAASAGGSYAGIRRHSGRRPADDATPAVGASAGLGGGEGGGPGSGRSQEKSEGWIANLVWDYPAWNEQQQPSSLAHGGCEALVERVLRQTASCGGNGGESSRTFQRPWHPSQWEAFQAEEIRTRRDHEGWLSRVEAGLDTPIQDPLSLLGGSVESTRRIKETFTFGRMRPRDTEDR
eukprot:g4361.t1